VFLIAVVRAHQVKLRGFRVELGEIENALSELPGVQLAAALVLQDPTGSQRLVAYVTPAFADPAAAKADLRERLPAHMVPDVVVPLERMPLLPNEKVDRQRAGGAAAGGVAGGAGPGAHQRAGRLLCRGRQLAAGTARIPSLYSTMLALLAAP